MDNYKLAFIYGTNEPNKQILDGKIEYIGEIAVFKNMNVRYQPEAVGYVYTLLGHALFFNTTSHRKDTFERYGKTGFSCYLIN